MILLKATTESLRLTTSSTADIDYSVSYADITTTTFAPSTSEGKITTAATTTILVAPGASTQRQIKLITISNIHVSTSNSVKVNKYDSSGPAAGYNLTPTVTLLAGETMQYIDGNGWVYYTATGSVKGSYPGATGIDKSIQFNDGGTALGSDADLAFDKVNQHLEVGLNSNSGVLSLGVNTTDQPAASANQLFIYGKNISGRMMPKWIGPSGVDTPFQPFLGFNGIKQVAPAVGITPATCMTAFATAFTNTATTIAQVAVTSTSIKTRMRSVTLATSATAGTLASHFNAQYEVCGAGGYFFSARFYVSGTIQSGQRGFHGLAGRITIFTNVDPTTEFATAKIGLGYALTGTTGNWKIVASSTTAALTAIDLGATDFSVNINDVIELVLYCTPGASSMTYRVTNLTSLVSATGSISGNIPATTVPLGVHNFVTNNATAGIATFGLNKWYLESDY